VLPRDDFLYPAKVIPQAAGTSQINVKSGDTRAGVHLASCLTPHIPDGPSPWRFPGIGPQHRLIEVSQIECLQTCQEA